MPDTYDPFVNLRADSGDFKNILPRVKREKREQKDENESSLVQAKIEDNERLI